MPELLEIAAKGGVNLKSAVTRRFSLDQAHMHSKPSKPCHVIEVSGQASEAYKLLNDGKIAGRALIEVS